jgi:multimeric flavodoxin WrbA
MKAVAFNGSARKDGNTAMLIKEVFRPMEAEGIETELVQLSGMNLAGCIACYVCADNKDRRCAVDTDDMNSLIEKMDSADAIILGSPSYFSDVSAGMKALIERAGVVSRSNGNMLRRRVGAPVCAVRRCGASHVLSSLNFFFFIAEMVVPGSSYWNMGRGKAPGQVLDDEEGMKTMADLGTNMAWLMKKLQG